MGYRSIISLMPKNSVDADAQAFLTAAAITDPTISGAINTLVVQMKADNIWSKMKAVYPMVGGTANSHKFNLKDPRDLDVAFRLSFLGGWTHSANGALPNGTNGYANTFLNPLSVFGSNYASQGSYFRTTFTAGQTNISGPTNGSQRLDFGYDNGVLVPFNANGSNSSDLGADNDNRGLIVSTRQGASVVKLFRNNVLKINGTQSFNSYPSFNYFIAARNASGTPLLFSNMGNLAFHFIGDGLNDTESANLYTAVQTFQTSLGRSVGTQTVSDADAQAFVTNAAIVDQVEATAVNNLVVGMKADGIWSKMKAIYPFVGGSASAHKFNLKDPRDLDAAFRLQFNGGWTHSSNGALPNGANGFANTFFNARTSLSIASNSQGQYQTDNKQDIGFRGVWDNTTAFRFEICTQSLQYGNACRTLANGADLNPAAIPDTRGLILSKSDGGSFKFIRNTTTIASTASGSINYPNRPYYLGALNHNGTSQFFSNMPISFSFLGDGLTDTEAANLYTRVQAFQTALSRQV